MTRARFNTEINAFQQQNGLFKCIDKRCKICSLYILEGHSLIMSNNMRWELQSHVSCRSINVIYYLKYNMCNVCKCGLKNKCLNEPFFEIKVMMKLKSSYQLETYENYFHKKSHDTLNYPEHLKK